MLWLQALYYFFIAEPRPLIGLFDFYVLNPLGALFQKRYKTDQLTLRERLGGGNFGQVLVWPSAEFLVTITLPSASHCMCWNVMLWLARYMQVAQG